MALVVYCSIMREGGHIFNRILVALVVYLCVLWQLRLYILSYSGGSGRIYIYIFAFFVVFWELGSYLFFVL